MDPKTAITAEHISKTFIIPHEKSDTFRERLIRFEKKWNYELFDALKDVSFEVRKGEFFGIIGRNGSGKSTLLKILAGIYTPDKGKVTVNGEISPFLELGVGFNPELSGRDNIYLNGTILGLSKKEISARFDKIMEFSELERFIDQKLKNYSSGMQVRLAFSVAVNTNKDILMMDEVMAVGDTSFQAKCFKVFEDIIKSGKTIIFVSHDTVLMRKYAERVLYLESGQPSFIGSASEAVSKYMYTDLIKDDQPAPLPEIVTTVKENARTDTGTVTGHGNDGIQDNQTPPATKKIVEVTEVRIYENDTDENKVLTNGIRMQIRVCYNVTQVLEDLIFGIIVRNHLRHDMIVTNTFAENIKTGEITPGLWLVTFDLPNLFAPGTYSVSPAVCDKTQRIFYDWKDDFAYFHVQNPARAASYGGIEPPHGIYITKKP
jgi:ABC-type polysaccharide/polyol phosphate transport system ATPase subunit